MKRLLLDGNIGPFQMAMSAFGDLPRTEILLVLLVGSWSLHNAAHVQQPQE